jgi:hypothetical protein
MSERYIEVVEFETGKVVHKVDVSDKSECQADRVMDGMDRNLNHEKFYTRFSNDSTEKP